MEKDRIRLFTSESVTEGHPDKVCDQISDAVLDAIITDDKNARVACETMATTGLVLVTGEITTDCYVDIAKVARSVIRDIGYTGVDCGFDSKTCSVLTAIDEQSPDIDMGVSSAYESRGENGSHYDKMGAGDQGIMFGYACNDTKELMPLALSLSQKLAKRLADVRKDGTLEYLRPDGKTQVTIEYEGLKAKRVDTIVVSTQHSEDVSLETIRKDMVEHVINPTIEGSLIDMNTRILVNPTGRFVVGGPLCDSGLTGRKIIVDTYGGYGHHGGGAFSGKDPTKVDRSGAYMARYAAKNVVAAELATHCEIQLAYAIGVAKPVSVLVNTFDTGKVPEIEIEKAVKKVFDFRPAAIIEELDLLRPIYRKLAAYGHFGREDLNIDEVKWERTDKVDELKKLI